MTVHHEKFKQATKQPHQFTLVNIAFISKTTQKTGCYSPYR